MIAEEVCHRAGIDGGIPTDGLSKLEKIHLAHTFLRVIEDIRSESFEPNIVYKGREPLEFASVELTQYQDMQVVSFPSISNSLETYYS